MERELQNRINLAIRYYDQAEAIEILSELKNSGFLDLANRDVLKLYYIRINSLSMLQLYSVMEASVLVSYEIEDYLLSSRVIEYLRQYNNIEEEVNFCRKVAQLLRRSEEPLGDYFIKFLSSENPPTIENWINDYTTASGVSKRDALSLMRYINTSENVKFLNPGQRLILKDVFELLSYCDSTVMLWENFPDDLDENDLKNLDGKVDWNQLILGLSQQGEDAGNLRVSGKAVSDIDSVQSQLPQEPMPAQPQQLDLEQPQSFRKPETNLRATPSATLKENKYVPPVKQPTSQQSAVNQQSAQEQSTQINQQPVSQQEASQQEPEAAAQAVLDQIQASQKQRLKPNQRMNLPNQYSANPAKIHDIINQAKPRQKAGVVMDPTNISIEEEKRRLEQDRDNKQDLIQTKLEELRKRNQNKQ